MALPEIGSEFAGYRIDALIGRGGMGVVYRAIQTRLDRRVALKLILPELGSDPNFRRRFERECRMAAALDHASVIPIYEAGEVDGELFVSMRYVDGIDLGRLIAKHGRMEPKAAVTIVAQVADALDAAHHHGLVHRDVKPANVLLEGGAAGRVYLTDFGLAKRVSSKTGLTRTRQFVGTIDYTAPEQIQGGAVDYRADVYALGCLIHHVLTAHPPYERETDFAALWAHVNDPPPSARKWVPDLPADVDTVLARAMAKEPEARYLSAGDVAAAVAAAVEGRPVVRPERTVARGAAISAPTPQPRQTTTDVAEAAPPAPPPRAGPPTEAWQAAAPAISGTPLSPAATTVDPSAVVPTPDAAAAGRRKPTTLPVALVLVTAAIAGVAAFVISGIGSDGSKVDLARLVSAGTVELDVPADWRRLQRPPRIPGITFIDQISEAPAGAPEGEAMLAGRVDSGGPPLLPRSFLARLAAEPRRDDPVLLGDVPAYRYRNLRPRGFDRDLTLYVAPTTRAVVTIACMAPPARAADFMAECEESAGSLRLKGEAEPFSLRPGGGYQRTLDTTMRGLNATRRAGLRALRTGNTAAAQAAAAARVEQAYARAGSRLGGARFSPAARDANSGLVKAMRGARASWAQLAAAARIGDSAGYARARARVRRAEQGVRRALTSLKPLGYRIG